MHTNFTPLKHRNRISLVLFVGLLVFLGLNTPIFADAPSMQKALVVITAGQDYPTTLSRVQDAGGRITHQFPPAAAIVHLPDTATLPDDITFFTNPVSDATQQGWSQAAQQAARSWNRLQQSPQERPAQIDLGAEFGTAAFEVPAEAEMPAARPDSDDNDPQPNDFETSQFLIGSIAVGLVFPESNGTTDPSSEDWTATELDLVSSEIVQALDWWVELEPAAHLSFVYHNFDSQTTPTGVEPITRPYPDQRYWIEDTMNSLGFEESNYFKQVRAHNNYLRETYQTDWAFTIFVVDSSNDADNRFSDRFFAYAYLGGPFLVMTYGNNGYGPQNMDAVAAHELGHIFHALDQYAVAQQGCEITAGYLGIENQNSLYGDCSSNEPSIMRGQIAPYRMNQIDYYARGQLGWHDSDNNGILDPVDVTVRLNNLIPQATRFDNQSSFAGTLTAQPVDSPELRPVLINKLTQVEYRVDDGSWLAAQPLDGTFDSYTEAFSFTTEALPSGTHQLYLRCTDNFGKISEFVLDPVEVVDPVEQMLNTTFDSVSLRTPSVAQGDQLTLSGHAQHLGGIAIQAVEIRLDSGAWTRVSPSDGYFDSDTEKFTYVIDSTNLAVGAHQLHARAIDADGHVECSPAEINFTIQDVPQNTSHTLFLPLIPKNW